MTVGRRQEKRWGVLFICLTLRAIHLEVAHSLNADSAIMALRRLIGRRGTPEVIFSDNGTNFRAAAEELKKAVEDMNKKAVAENMSQRQIDWKFIPPSAPHMGGSWERLIRSVKTTFSFIFNNQKLKDELLLTLFSEAEYIVNSRPLTYVSSDSNDPEALTPNHFIMRAPPSEANCFHSADNSYYRKQWQKCQQMSNSFWKRWVKEYLPTLSRRTKWTDETDPIKENEIVVIVEDNLPRNRWKLGKIVAAIPGRDGRIRVVDVQTRTGVKRRPVSKVCRLKLEE